MHVLNAAAILKDSPDVLSWNDDIYLVHYQQMQESEKVNIAIQMNLISLVLNGRKEILHHSGKMTVPAGSGFFMKKGSYLMTERIGEPQVGYEAITILFSDEWIQAEAGNMFPPGREPQLQERQPGAANNIVLLPEDELVNLLTAQFRAYFTGSASRKRLQTLLPLKIRELFQVLLSVPGQPGLEAQLRSVGTSIHPDLQQLMQAHFKENLSLEHYAFLANCSLSTFKRKFSQTFNMPPKKWIQQRRLEEAYHLLGKATLNISEIAYEVGFESPAHFISSFKEQYQITPKQLQQRLASVSFT